MTARKPAAEAFRNGRPLDDSGRSALEGLVRIEMRSGFSVTDIRRTLEKAIQNSSPLDSAVTDGAAQELRLASHVMTVWHDDPRYLADDGRPKALTRAALNAMAREVARDLDANQLLPYLIRAGNVRRVGGKYAAVKREVILRGMTGPWDARMVRIVDAMLRTADHNSLPANQASGWIERSAENDNFPVSRLEEFALFLEREMTTFLHSIDDYMRRGESDRKVAEPTVHLIVGAYRSQQETAGVQPATSSERVTRRSRSRRSP